MDVRRIMQSSTPGKVTGKPVSEQLRATIIEKLRLSEERYRALYDDNPSMYFTVAPDGTILSVNEFGAQQLGYTKEELVGRSVLVVVHPPDHATARRSLIQCQKNKEGTLAHWEFRKVRKNGTVLWVREAARIITGPEGDSVILVTCEDITDRKQAEDALRKRERQLQRAIEERARMSQDLHDGLLQSLYAIGLGLEAAKPLTVEDPKRASRRISQAMTQLNRVMEDVRRFIAGLAPDPMHGSSLEATLKRLVQNTFGTQTPKFGLEIDAEAAQRLTAQQAFHITNIAQEAISNSLRHSGAKMGSLSLRDLRDTTRLEIHDNGNGFDRVEAAGRGHGLRNMRNRARQIGGRLTIQAKPGFGTRIVVDIPHEDCRVGH